MIKFLRRLLCWHKWIYNSNAKIAEADRRCARCGKVQVLIFNPMRVEIGLYPDNEYIWETVKEDL